MFTMKKFAMLAVAGLLATSMLACTEDTEEDDDSSSSGGGTSSPSGSAWTVSDISGSGWTKKTSIALGSAAHATLGSFLDVDGNITATGGGDVIRYKVGEVGTHKDEVDLIYDGTNLWTPAGCNTSASCPSVLKTPITGSVSEAAIYKVSGISPSSSAKAIAAAANAAAANTTNIVNNVVLEPKGIYYLKTSENADALILVGEEGTNQIDIIVGYIYDIEDL